jgi:ABC-2 type transport system permease protein
MTGALRYEWVRIRTIASSYWLSGLAVVLSAGIAVILCLVVNSAQSTAGRGNDLGDLAPPTIFTTWIVTAGASGPVMPVLTAVFFAVMGAMAMGHEYRYGTNKATLTAIPDRLAVISAKSVVLTAWVAVTSVLILVVNYLVALLLVSRASLDSGALRPLLFYVLYAVGFALAGMYLATILRSQVGAIVTVLVWPMALEPIVFAILRFAGRATDVGLGKFANLLPASAGRRSMFRPYDLFANLDVSLATIWSLPVSTIVFWCGIALLVASGCYLFFTRDA